MAATKVTYTISASERREIVQQALVSAEAEHFRLTHVKPPSPVGTPPDATAGQEEYIERVAAYINDLQKEVAALDKE